MKPLSPEPLSKKLPGALVKGRFWKAPLISLALSMSERANRPSWMRIIGVVMPCGREEKPMP
jgi:hypothetical protein